MKTTRSSLLSVILLCFLSCIVADQCISSTDLRFYSQNQRLEAPNGFAISIKGLNWWGTEGDQFTLGGLNTQSMTYYLDILHQNGFNALRIPFSLDMALNPTRRYASAINGYYNPSLSGALAVDMIDQLFQQAAARGILILLDQHHFDRTQIDSTPSWYTWLSSPNCITNPDGVCKVYSYQDHLDGWNYLVGKFKKYWNFMGIDLLNEPHGWVRWGSSNLNVDWPTFATNVSNYVINQHPDWHGMFFVEGIELNPDCEILGFPGCEDCGNDGHWWGSNFEGLRCKQIELVDNTRLVYSPHLYGPSVYFQSYFGASDFPNNLPYIWDTHFGFASALTDRAVIVGEWGGPLSGLDLQVQNAQSAYFKSKGFSTFYWALNPNPGGDTDGVFENDFLTPNPAKLQFLAMTHPTPTTFSASGSQICMSGGVTTAPPPPSPTTAPTTPPSSGSNTVCAGPVGEGASAVLSCPTNQVISSITFASFGTPSGSCGSFAVSSTCNAPTSLSVTQTTCLNKQSCTIVASNAVFSDPCPNVGKHFSVQAVCSSASSGSPTTAPTSAPVAPTSAPVQPTVAPTAAPVAPTSAPSQPSAGNIKAQLNSGTNGWWFGLTLSNDNSATKTVEIRDHGSLTSWTALSSTNWGAWILSPTNQVVAPIDVRITSSSGAQVTATNVWTSLTDTTQKDLGGSYAGVGAPSAPSSPTQPPTVAAKPPTSAPTSAPSAPTSAPSAPTSAPTKAPSAGSPTTAPTTPASTGGATIKFQQNTGNSNWWFGVAVSGGNKATSAVYFKDSGSYKSYTLMTLQDWGYYTLAPSSALVAPITIQAVSASGATVSASFSGFTPNQVVDTGSNY